MVVLPELVGVDVHFKRLVAYIVMVGVEALVSVPVVVLNDIMESCVLLSVLDHIIDVSYKGIIDNGVVLNVFMKVQGLFIVGDGIVNNIALHSCLYTL